MRIYTTLGPLIFALLFVFAPFSAYAENPIEDHPLLGRWEKPDGSYIELARNGLAYGGDPTLLESYVQDGTYSLDGDTIRLQFDIPFWLNLLKRDVDQTSRFHFDGANVLIFEEVVKQPKRGKAKIKTTRFIRVTMVTSN